MWLIDVSWVEMLVTEIRFLELGWAKECQKPGVCLYNRKLHFPTCFFYPRPKWLVAFLFPFRHMHHWQGTRAMSYSWEPLRSGNHPPASTICICICEILDRLCERSCWCKTETQEILMNMDSRFTPKFQTSRTAQRSR